MCLAGSFRGILKPAVPKAIIGKPVLSGAGFENFIPGFGPGKFVFESGHGAGTQSPIFEDIVETWEGKVKKEGKRQILTQESTGIAIFDS